MFNAVLEWLRTQNSIIQLRGYQMTAEKLKKETSILL